MAGCLRNIRLEGLLVVIEVRGYFVVVDVFDALGYTKLFSRKQYEIPKFFFAEMVWNPQMLGFLRRFLANDFLLGISPNIDLHLYRRYSSKINFSKP